MAEGDKPYRVYKGGRTKGKVPLATRPTRATTGDGAGPERRKGRRSPRWGRRVGLTILLLGVLLIVWLVASYLSFRSGVAEANDRLPAGVEAGLAPQDGLVISNPTLIVLLGTDGDKTEARADARRSDSILLVRTDPARHRIAYLSIPRDLRVEIPGFGSNKINAAFQLGGPALALQTIRSLTGLPPQPRCPRGLRRLPHGHRRARGNHGRRAEADPLQPLRLPLPDGGALPAVGGLALRGGRADDGRPPRADLLARAREPARPGRERLDAWYPPAGGGRGDGGRAGQPGHAS